VRVLVTGGLGFIGFAVAQRLVGAGHEVAVLTRGRPGDQVALPGAEVLRADLRDRDRLRDLVRRAVPEGVCHLAARTHVRESFTDPLGHYDTNLVGTLSLLHALAHHTERTGRPVRLVAASSAMVYGASDGRPIDEEHPAVPTSPYGASKLAAEQLIGCQAATGALGAVSLRAFSAAGAVGSHGDADQRRIIPKALAVAAGLASELEINGDGSAVREFTHIADIADAYLLALGAAQPGAHRIYNLGSGRGVTVNDVVRTVEAVTGRPLEVTHRPRADEPAALIADTRRIHAELGWVAARSSIDQIIQDAWKAVSTHLPGDLAPPPPESP